MSGNKSNKNSGNMGCLTFVILYIILPIFIFSLYDEIVDSFYDNFNISIGLISIIRPIIFIILLLLYIILFFKQFNNIMQNQKRISEESERKIQEEEEIKRKKIAQEREKQRIEKEKILQQKLKDIKEGNLKEIEIKDLILGKKEVCYIEERVIGYKVKKKVTSHGGLFYITSDRVILKTGIDNFDKKLEQITSIAVGYRKIELQFSSLIYIIEVDDPVIYKNTLEYLIQRKLETKRVTVCSYCGTDNISAATECKKCGAPLKKD